MKFKSVFASLAVIVVLTLTSITPIPRAEAGPNQNGPYLDHLYFKEYTSTAPEWLGMKICDIDIMASGLARFRSVSENGPTGLSIPQYNEWLQNPSLQALIAIDQEIQLGMYEFDINTHDTMGLPGAIYSKPLVPSPTSDPAFRAAVAKLVDKVSIATQDFSGLLEIMDVPLAPPYHTAYVNTNAVGLQYNFKYNGPQAQLDFTAAGYVLDPSTPNPYASLYPWGVPFMRKNALTGNLIGTDYNWGGGNEGLVIYARSDIPELTAAGLRLRNVLRASGIPVMFVLAPKSTCFNQVKVFFGYHFYTGSWELNWVPDHLHDFYTSEYANPYDFNYMLFNGLGPAHPNGPTTKSAALEALLDTVKNALNQPNMITAAQNVQMALWGPTTSWFPVVGGMPSIILGHINPLRTAYKNGWMDIVNMQGVGVGNWWSYFLGNYPPNPTVNTIRVGLPNPIQNLNTVTAEWTHDLAVLENIYDPLIGFDPYNIQTSVPTGLANNWVVSTGSSGNTEVKFTLRSGLKWHPNQAMTFTPANGGNGAIVPASPPTGNPLTVDDAAYSWLYHQAQYGWFYSSVYQIFEIQTKNGPPTLPPPVGAFPYPALTNPPSGLTATWTADINLNPDDIVAKMSLSSWLALRWLGEVPIIPMFIWANVLDAYAFDPVSANAVVGSGPWKFNTWATGNFMLLDANRDYFLSIGSGTADEFIRESFHRRGDAGGIGGSGPNYYDGKVYAYDLAYFASVYSTIEPYQDWSTWPSLLRVTSYTGGIWTTVGTAPYLNAKLDGSYIYSSASGVVSGEIDLQDYAAGQYVAGVDFYLSLYSTQPSADNDADSPLIGFAADEKHTENKPTNGLYDLGEYMYKDVDGSGTVTERDIRLTAVPSHDNKPPYPAGSTVKRGDADLTPVSDLISFDPNEKHTENIVDNNMFDPGEYMYKDVDGSGTVTEGDVRLTAVGLYPAGSTVKNIYDDVKVEIWNSYSGSWQQVAIVTPPAGAYDWTHLKVGRTGEELGEWTEAMTNAAKVRLTYTQVGLGASEISVDMAALDPPYWRDNVYGPLIYSTPISPGEVPPFDGDGLIWDGTNWVSAPYPWRAKNPGAGPAYLYVDFNYDLWVDSFDFAILGTYWSTDAGSGW